MGKNKKTQIPGEVINDTITDLKIEQLIPNIIDDFIVTIFEDHHTIALPMNITGTEFRVWYRGRGGVFSKDVLHFALKKPHGKYVLIKGEKLYCIARLITEKEEVEFNTMKLVNGRVKDRAYMILKNLQEGEKLSSTQRYINENDMEQEDNIYVAASVVATQDDDLCHHPGSISLFSE